MEEFTDLINKLLQGFDSTHSEAEKVEVKELDTFRDNEGVTYLDVRLEGTLPKKSTGRNKRHRLCNLPCIS